jgi:Na+/H+-dicarboxylate symporter
VGRFTLPLSASVFKINRVISSPVKFVFLGHLFGIPLDTGRMAAFLVMVMALSVTAVGIPRSTGSLKSLPAYLSVGIPAPGVIFLEPMEAIIDLFKTLANTTSYMSVAAIVNRVLIRGNAEQTVPVNVESGEAVAR